jgi:hypothetical protein
VGQGLGRQAREARLARRRPAPQRVSLCRERGLVRGERGRFGARHMVVNGWVKPASWRWLSLKRMDRAPRPLNAGDTRRPGMDVRFQCPSRRVPGALIDGIRIPTISCAPVSAAALARSPGRCAGRRAPHSPACPMPLPPLTTLHKPSARLRFFNAGVFTLQGQPQQAGAKCPRQRGRGGATRRRTPCRRAALGRYRTSPCSRARRPALSTRAARAHFLPALVTLNLK